MRRRSSGRCRKWTRRSGRRSRYFIWKICRIWKSRTRWRCYRGQNVSLLRFERDGKEFQLVVARRGDVCGLGESVDRTVNRVPQFVDRSKKKLAAAIWADAKNFHVLMSDAEMDTVKRLLWRAGSARS